MDFWKRGRLSKAETGDLNRILKLILASCSKETSSDPDNWREENPLHGHCAIIAILMWKIVGGSILRASLENVRGYEQMRSHYWNGFPDGTEVDMSAGQFKGDDRNLVPAGQNTKNGELITAEDLLKNESTAKRFILFRKRFLENFHKIRSGCRIAEIAGRSAKISE